MAVCELGLPPNNLATDKLTFKRCQPSTLYRISRYTSGEPHFGRTGANRFDAPGCLHGAAEFGASYLGFSLAVALAESILHDEMPVMGGFQIAPTVFENSHLIRFDGKPLKLANLTGAALKRYGGTADLSGTSDYATTQQWSLAVHRNPGNFDGFVYMSRHLNTGMATILFDRARPKLQMTTAMPLLRTPGFAAAAKLFGIVGM